MTSVLSTVFSRTSVSSVFPWFECLFFLGCYFYLLTIGYEIVHHKTHNCSSDAFTQFLLSTGTVFRCIPSLSRSRLFIPSSTKDIVFEYFLHWWSGDSFTITGSLLAGFLIGGTAHTMIGTLLFSLMFSRESLILRIV